MDITPSIKCYVFFNTDLVKCTKQLIRVFFTSLFILFYTVCFSQDSLRLKFNNYSSEDIKIVRGLSQNSVNCIWQDSKGFMWFGTWDGLNRFDGLNFVIYLPGFKDYGQNINNQTIRTIFEDKGNNFWIGTESGLALLNRKTQQFVKYTVNNLSKTTISSNIINCIFEDNEGLLWIGTRQGISVLNKKTGIFKTINRNNSHISCDTINKIIQDKSGLIWIATRNGLNCYNKSSLKCIKYFYEADNANSLSNSAIKTIIIDKNNIIWLGTANGLNSFDKTKNIFTRYYLPDNNNYRITAILEDSNNRFWVATYGGGLKLFNKNLGKFYSYQNNPSDQFSVTNNFINCIYEDNTGIIWVGNANKGVDKIDPHYFMFDVYRHIPYNSNSLCNNIVWSVFEDENELLWIGTASGLNIWDRKRNIWMQFVNEFNKNKTFSSNNIRSIYKDKEGNIWLGTDDTGVDKFNTKTGELTNYSNNPENKNSFCNNTVWSIIEDNSGYIWFGTANGLAKYDKKQNKFKFYFNNENDIHSLSNNFIFNIFQDSKNNIWVSTNSGLCLYNKLTDNFKVYKISNTKGTSINNNSVFSVYEDKFGNLWVCTMGGGLNKLDIKTNKFSYFTENEGLPNNVVYSVIEDKSGCFWLSTNHGLCRFNPNNAACINYDVRDGLQSYEYNVGAALMTKKGEIFFGGMNGFNLFNPEEIPNIVFAERPVITGFRIFNKLNYREYYNEDTIELSYLDNFFSFEFAALNFSNGANIFYEFKLDNINTTWIQTDADHKIAEFTNIEPGNYKFRVRASSTNYFSDSKETVITLIIIPPWWKTWIFRISFVIVILLFLGYVIRVQYKRIKRKNEIVRTMLEMEKKIFETERKALRLQMNPHFIFNTLNAIQYFIFQNDKLSANKYISMFSKLIRQILVNSQQNTILLKDDLTALELYVELELLRFENMFDFKISVLPDASILEYQIPSMILQPYVENAIRHGLIHRKEKGLLQIIVKKEEAGRILCVIEDNGIGREKAEEIRQKTKPDHQSLGIQITESRLRLINKLYGGEMFINTSDLKDSVNNAIGTRVELSIPVMEKTNNTKAYD